MTRVAPMRRSYAHVLHVHSPLPALRRRPRALDRHSVPLGPRALSSLLNFDAQRYAPPHSAGFVYNRTQQDRYVLEQHSAAFALYLHSTRFVL